MQSFVFLVLVSIHLSKALLLPLNSSTLQLPSQDTIAPIGDLDTHTSLTANNNWPSPPYQRYIKNGLTINIAAYGDPLAKRYTPYVLQAILSIQRLIRNAGELNDVLEEITTVGEVRGVIDTEIYTEIGFYALHPPAGIKRSQAGDVLHTVWQLVIEFHPARDITISTIIEEGHDLVLFRLSFRPK